MVMTSRSISAALVVGASAVALAAPVQAQRAAKASQKEESTVEVQQPAGATAGAIKISPQAQKAVIELQTAVNAKDSASIPSKLAAAQAVARTPQDRYFIAKLQLKAAADANNPAGVAAAVDAVAASGAAEPAELNRLRLTQANLHYGSKDYAKASAALEPLIAADPNNAEALVLLAETRNGQNRAAEGVPLLQKAIAVRTASGQPVPKEWHKRAVALAYNNKLPVAGQLAVEWVKNDPSPTNWRDAIRIYADSANIPQSEQVDLYRLQRAAGALKGEGDYFRYAEATSTKGLPGEAKAVLDEGFASGAISRTAPAFRSFYPLVSSKVAADKASLPAAERTALAGAAARPAMVTGDAYLGYGDYAKAAALYRAALTKSGVDANLANLRLGIALARSGDKPGATAAFNAVSGPQQATARLWLAWLDRRA